MKLHISVMSFCAGFVLADWGVSGLGCRGYCGSDGLRQRWLAPWQSAAHGLAAPSWQLLASSASPCRGAEWAVLTWVSQEPDGWHLAGTLPRGDPFPCRLVPLC